ncbi:MAG: ferredoxin [Verrucomicrobiota bacterium]
MKVTIDRDTCTGCELCTTLCPDVFEMGDDNLATVKGGDIPASAVDSVKEAASSCPVECIKIVE